MHVPVLLYLAPICHITILICFFHIPKDCAGILGNLQAAVYMFPKCHSQKRFNPGMNSEFSSVCTYQMVWDGSVWGCLNAACRIVGTWYQSSPMATLIERPSQASTSLMLRWAHHVEFWFYHFSAETNILGSNCDLINSVLLTDLNWRCHYYS